MLDVWRCNTTGSYSSFAQETLLVIFNRRLQPINLNEIMPMKTSLPGWHQGSATHIHIAAHINGEVDKEIHTYQGGMADHVGQVFFAEEILEAAAADAPYSTNKVVRLRNVEDGIFLQENTGYCWMEWTVSLK